MAKQNKKQKRKQKRKVRVKRERSRRQGRQALLRKDPLLHEALNHRHPLADCRINEDWREAKSAMVHVVREAPAGKILAAFLVDQYGPDWESRKDVDWTDLIDKLLLERPLADGKSIARQFVEHYSGIMSDDVRRLVLGWHDVIQGFFEIEGHTGDRLDIFNLINERRYRAYATAPQAMAGVGIGDFLMARIVPAGRRPWNSCSLTSRSRSSPTLPFDAFRSAFRRPFDR